MSACFKRNMNTYVHSFDGNGSECFIYMPTLSLELARIRIIISIPMNVKMGKWERYTTPKVRGPEI